MTVGWSLGGSALLVMNAAAFAAFWLDKRRARNGRRRIRENGLLLFALLGGTVGAYLGRWCFRHKTRKAGFSNALHLIALAQIAIIAGFFVRG